jgi:hypothetical protein
MGFTGFPPRPSLALILQTIDLWSRRADAALILNEPPWDSLLAGRPAEALIRNNQLGLAQYYRAKNLRVIVSVDPTNGLDRASDSGRWSQRAAASPSPRSRRSTATTSSRWTRCSSRTTWASRRRPT